MTNMCMIKNVNSKSDGNRATLRMLIQKHINRFIEKLYSLATNWCGCRDLNPGYQRGRLMSYQARRQPQQLISSINSV